MESESGMRRRRTLGARGVQAMACTEAASEHYNARIGAAARRMAYGLAGVSNWYKSSSGRVTQNWPLSTVDFWRQMQAVQEQDFDFWG